MTSQSFSLLSTAIRAVSNETKQSDNTRATKTSKTENQNLFFEKTGLTSENNCYEPKLQTIFFYLSLASLNKC